jgi:hypothetical protein
MNAAPCLASEHSLDRLSDSELLAATRSLVGRSNQLLAALLAHLGEVEARGIHRIRACSSLYTYCIHDLRLSEDEAYRRVAASRLVRRFPALLEAIASGELHLTGLLMLGPHLTENNISEVLRRAKHRTKKEVAALVRVLDPLPDVPARIDPLGPAPTLLTSGAPSWPTFVRALCPVRELAPGDRPRDWVAKDESPVSNDEGQVIKRVPGEQGPVPSDAEGAEQMGGAPLGTAEARLAEPGSVEAPAPARLEPQRYRVQFTASEEYVRLVDEAKALLAHASLRVGLDEIHLRALRVLVTELKKRKYAVTSEPRKSDHSAPPSSAPSNPAPSSSAPSNPAPPSSAQPGRGRFGPGLSGHAPTAASSEPPQAIKSELGTTKQPQPPRQRGKCESSEPQQAAKVEVELHTVEQPQPHQRERYVPAALRRAVFERDGGRCTYVSASGERCPETHALELHHLRAYALGGEHSEENLAYRCHAHNALAAEEDFGRDVVDERRDSLGHEPFARQRLRE